MSDLVIFGDEAWLREDFDALTHGKSWTYTVKGCRCNECKAAAYLARATQKLSRNGRMMRETPDPSAERTSHTRAEPGV